MTRRGVGGPVVTPADVPTADTVEAEIERWVASCYADPLRFVLGAYPWQEPGPLEREPGPDDNQREFLTSLGSEIQQRKFDGDTPVMPILMAETSGHGVGKSALGGWLVDFIMSTRPHCDLTVTAGTYTQLESRTWPAIKFWKKLSITAPWFDVMEGGIYAKDFPDTWKCQIQTCKKQNAQAFAGQHAKRSTSGYIFDEACHDDQTDVLTRRGWMRFKDVRLDDELFTKDPATHVAEYLRPVALHATPRRGEMFTYERRGCNFNLTPTHRLFVRQKNGRIGGYRARQFREVRTIAGKRSEYFMDRAVDWRAPDCDTFTIPALTSLTRTHQARDVAGDAWFTFLGWYYSEGSLAKRVNSWGAVEHISTAITNRDVSAARTLAEGFGFHPKTYRASTTQLLIHDRALAEHLAGFGVGALVKRIPPYVMAGSARQINLFLDAYVAGDGYTKAPRRDIIYTSNEGMADQLQELCIKGGAASVIRRRPLAGQVSRFATHDATSTRDGFVISRSFANVPIRVKGGEIRRTAYDGMVYCATLPRHHLLYTRRDGTCMWSGNSEVPDEVWQTAYGGLTDGEPMLFAWGQPVRNTGEFYRVCFGSLATRWNHRRVDGRTSRFTNKQLIAQWIADYGIESDFVKVRVLGLPPSASELQYIDKARVDAARKRVQRALPDDPLVAGFDVSGGGRAWNVIRFRRGLDGRVREPIRMPGDQDPDRSARVAICAELLRDRRPGYELAMLFVDAAFGAPIVARLQALGHTNVCEVNFGGDSPDVHQKNMRAFMHAQTKQWLLLGSIPDEDQLCDQLCLAGYHLDTSGKLVIESKASIQERGESSPDDADALMLTFAQAVAPVAVLPPRPPAPRSKWG